MADTVRVEQTKYPEGIFTPGRPLILISNDDGYIARGINELIDMISDMADLLVVAPEAARSGMSCAFSAKEPLYLKKRIERKGVVMWSCTGTPADCVKIGLARLLPSEKMPDMVIGGINHGDNASVNTHYSGTMGVATEGCMKYIPSVAFSLCDHSADAVFTPCRDVIRQIVARVLSEGLPMGICLNVNFPLCNEFKGVRTCRMAYGTWGHETEKYRHPLGYDYYWMVGAYTNDEPDAPDTDAKALEEGYVAITPSKIDVTAYEAFDLVNGWNINI